MTVEEFQKSVGLVRAEARREPVEVTYNGRPELVIMSVEDYALLRRNRKLAFERADLTDAKIERIALNRMDEAYAHLDALMDD